MYDKINIYTIGFTRKTAEKFFGLIRNSGIKRIIDIRLNNSSQLSGFSKIPDLSFFLKEICNVEYIHLPILSPTKELLNEYKKSKIDWNSYEKKFFQIMHERKIENILDIEIIQESCFLCSEDKPHFCHRRLVAEYLSKFHSNIYLNHLY